MSEQTSPSTTNLRINYIEFPAKDLGRVKKFYADAFGWSFTDYGDEYTAFNDGAIDGGFHTFGEPNSEAGALVVLYAKDLEAAQDTVVAHGGTIQKEIFAFPGGRRFHFIDTEGNALAIWSDTGIEPA